MKLKRGGIAKSAIEYFIKFKVEVLHLYFTFHQRTPFLWAASETSSFLPTLSTKHLIALAFYFLSSVAWYLNWRRYLLGLVTGQDLSWRSTRNSSVLIFGWRKTDKAPCLRFSNSLTQARCIFFERLVSWDTFICCFQGLICAKWLEDMSSFSRR